MKKSAAVCFTGQVHIDAAAQRKFGKIDRDLSEFWVGHERRSRVKAVLVLVRIPLRRCCKKAVSDWSEAYSDLLIKCRISLTEPG
jgi:hypothetical protein